MPFSPHPEEPASDPPIAGLHPQAQPGSQRQLQSGPTRSLSFSQMPRASSLAQPNFASASAQFPSGRPGLDISHLHLNSNNQQTSSSHAAQDSLADSALPTFLPQQADLQQHEHHQTDLARQRGLHQFDAQGHHILGSEQQDAGFHEHGVPALEVVVSEQSISSQMSDLSAAEQGGAFPSRWGLPLGVTSPVIRAGWLHPSSGGMQASHPWLQIQRPQEMDGGDEVTYDLSGPTAVSSGMSELSQLYKGHVGSEGGDPEAQAPWDMHAPGGLHGGRGIGQWTSPVVQNPLFAGGSCLPLPKLFLRCML